MAVVVSWLGASLIRHDARTSPPGGPLRPRADVVGAVHLLIAAAAAPCGASRGRAECEHGRAHRGGRVRAYAAHNGYALEVWDPWSDAHAINSVDCAAFERLLFRRHCIARCLLRVRPHALLPRARRRLLAAVRRVLECYGTLLMIAVAARARCPTRRRISTIGLMTPKKKYGRAIKVNNLPTCMRLRRGIGRHIAVLTLMM